MPASQGPHFVIWPQVFVTYHARLAITLLNCEEQRDINPRTIAHRRADAIFPHPASLWLVGQILVCPSPPIALLIMDVIHVPQVAKDLPLLGR